MISVDPLCQRLGKLCAVFMMHGSNLGRRLRAMALTVALATLVGCMHHGFGKKPVAAPDRIAAIGESAPDFVLPSLDGSLVRLSSYADKVVVLAFWASFCSPCQQELPQLEALWKQSPDVVVLAIAVDDAESDELVRKAVSRMHLELPVLRDPEGHVAYTYGKTVATPMTFLIGRDGKLRARHYGLAPTLAERLRQQVSAALATP